MKENLVCALSRGGRPRSEEITTDHINALLSFLQGGDLDEMTIEPHGLRHNRLLV